MVGKVSTQQAGVQTDAQKAEIPVSLQVPVVPITSSRVALPDREVPIATDTFSLQTGAAPVQPGVEVTRGFKRFAGSASEVWSGVTKDPAVQALLSEVNGRDFTTAWQGVPSDFRRVLDAHPKGAIGFGIVLSDRVKVRLYEAWQQLPDGERLPPKRIHKDMERLRQIMAFVGQNYPDEALDLPYTEITLKALTELMRGDRESVTEICNWLDTFGFEIQIRELEQQNRQPLEQIAIRRQELVDHQAALQTLQGEMDRLRGDQGEWWNPWDADHEQEIAELQSRILAVQDEIASYQDSI